MDLNPSITFAAGDQPKMKLPRVPNPALAKLPRIPSLDSAFERMEFLPADATAETAVMPTLQHAHLAFDLVRAVYQSASERDLSSPDFQMKTFGAAELANHESDRHGHSIPAVAIAVPNAVPRGFLVAMPAGMGRLALRQALARLFGDKRDELDVETPRGWIPFPQLRILVVSFGSSGSLRAFAKGFVKCFDNAMGTNLFSKARGRIHRGEEEINALLQALGIAASLGCLVVEDINSRNAHPGKASELWDALARFTEATGIPIVCIVTPGAVAALSEQCSAIQALSCAGQYHMPAHASDSPHWRMEAEFIFERYLRALFKIEAPEWYFDVLWEETLGHTELAYKLCAHLSRTWADFKRSEPTPDDLRTAAKAALVLERPHLEAIKTVVVNGGKFSKTSVRRHGDWLPLELVMRSVPGLEDEMGARIVYRAAAHEALRDA